MTWPGAVLLFAASFTVSAHAATLDEPEPPPPSWLLEQRFQRGPLARLHKAPADQRSPAAMLASVLAERRRPLGSTVFSSPVPARARLLSPATPAAETWARVQQQVLAASGGSGCICAGDRADLDLLKSDAPDPVAPGGILVYTLDVTNFGPDRAGAVTVIDTLPAGVTYTGVVPGPPTCDFAAGAVSCDLGFLSSGAHEAVQITVTVGAGTSGIISNTANLGTMTFDPVSSNDGDTATTTVQPSSPGQTPDGSQGLPLRISRNALVPTDLDLSWGASCSGTATDYTIHEGALGTWYSHTGIVCSTGGALSDTVTPALFSTYYLIVPISPTAEGSYGLDGAGAERPRSATTCRPVQSLAACP